MYRRYSARVEAVSKRQVPSTTLMAVPFDYASGDEAERGY
jgi:hypothetical protein